MERIVAGFLGLGVLTLAAWILPGWVFAILVGVPLFFTGIAIISAAIGG